MAAQISVRRHRRASQQSLVEEEVEPVTEIETTRVGVEQWGIRKQGSTYSLISEEQTQTPRKRAGSQSTNSTTATKDLGMKGRRIPKKKRRNQAVSRIVNIDAFFDTMDKYDAITRGYTLLGGYIMFYLLYIVVIFLQKDTATTYWQETTIISRLSTPGQRMWNEVSTEDEWADWYLNSFLESVLGAQYYLDVQKTASQKGMLGNNRLIGSTATFTSRYKIENCTKGLDESVFNHFDSTCYTGIDTDPFGPEANPFEYIVFTGHGEVFEGYAIPPTTDKMPFEQAVAINLAVLNQGFLDPQTASIVTQFATFNAQTQLFSFTTVAFDRNEGGNFDPSVKVVSIDVRPYSSVGQRFRLFCEVVLVIGLIFQTIWFVKRIRDKLFEEDVGLRFILSVMNGWDGVDMFAIIWYTLVVVTWCRFYLAMRSFVIASSYEVYDPLTGDLDLVKLDELVQVFLRIKELSNLETQYRYFASLGVALGFVRLFKFFNFQRRMNILSFTLKRAAPDLLHFCIMFFSVFLGYAFVGHYLFGNRVKNFSTFLRSTEVLFQWLFGEFEYEEIREANKTGSILFFFSFMIALAIIFINIFLAIVLDAYADCKDATDESPVFWEELRVRGIRLLNRMRFGVTTKLLKKSSRRYIPTSSMKQRMEFLKEEGHDNVEVANMGKMLDLPSEAVEDVVTATGTPVLEKPFGELSVGASVAVERFINRLAKPRPSMGAVSLGVPGQVGDDPINMRKQVRDIHHRMSTLEDMTMQMHTLLKKVANANGVTEAEIIGLQASTYLETPLATPKGGDFGLDALVRNASSASRSQVGNESKPPQGGSPHPDDKDDIEKALQDLESDVQQGTEQGDVGDVTVPLPGTM